MYSNMSDSYQIQSQYIFQDFAPQLFDRIRKLSGISKEDYLVIFLLFFLLLILFFIFYFYYKFYFFDI